VPAATVIAATSTVCSVGMRGWMVFFCASGTARSSLHAVHRLTGGVDCTEGHPWLDGLSLMADHSGTLQNVSNLVEISACAFKR
jgi:hypothetical protein